MNQGPCLSASATQWRALQGFPKGWADFIKDKSVPSIRRSARAAEGSCDQRSLAEHRCKRGSQGVSAAVPLRACGKKAATILRFHHAIGRSLHRNSPPVSSRLATPARTPSRRSVRDTCTAGHGWQHPSGGRDRLTPAKRTLRGGSPCEVGLLARWVSLRGGVQFSLRVPAAQVLRAQLSVAPPRGTLPMVIHRAPVLPQARRGGFAAPCDPRLAPVISQRSLLTAPRPQTPSPTPTTHRLIASPPDRPAPHRAPNPSQTRQPSGSKTSQYKNPIIQAQSIPSPTA